MKFLNKSGHCASNEKIWHIDIGKESTILQQEILLSDQFLRELNFCTALSCDNFDVNISSLPGADSLHYTFGICHQDESKTSKEVNKRDETVRKNQKML